MSITPEGNNEISTKPPMNVPKMLPALLSAESLPTTAPELFTSCIASRTTKGDTIPIKTLGRAKIAAEA